MRSMHIAGLQLKIITSIPSEIIVAYTYICGPLAKIEKQAML